MNLTIRPKQCTQYIAIYLMLMASAGYYLRCFSQTICYSVLLLALIVLLIGNKRIRINKQILFVSLFLCAAGLISSVLAGDSFEYTILPLMAWVISSLMISNIEIHEFKKVYVNIIVFISVISIVAWIVFTTAPRVLSIFPVITNSAGAQAYNLLFSVVPFNYGTGSRVQGIFWEPGAFQFFLGIALLFLRESNKNECAKKVLIAKYIILITAMIMTFSTTAYIALLLFCLLSITEKNKKLIMGIFIAVIVVAVIFCVPWLRETVNQVLVNKLSGLLEAFGGGSDNASSQVRFDSIYYPLVLFLKNPILGAGYNGLLGLKSLMGHGMTTCTPLNYFATYGIIYGSLILVLFFKLAKSVATKKRETMLIFIFLLTMVISEDFNATVCLNSFLLLGLKKIHIYGGDILQ